ncbi:MAG: hypothetical protein AAFY60_20030, partial [Myxococcota bacterium]
MATRLSSGDPESSAYLLRWIAFNEDRLYAINAIEPYRDLVPKLVARLSPERLAWLFERLAPHVCARILLGDYTRVDEQRIASVLECMVSESAGRVVTAMSVGVDWPTRVGPVLLAMNPEARVAVWGLLPRRTQSRVLHCCARLADSEELSALGARSSEARPSYEQEEPPIPVSGQGVRRSAREGWIRRTRIEEWLDSDYGRKRVVIDLLELDPKRHRVECARTQAQRLDYRRFSDVFSDPSPSEIAFRSAGMFRLGELVRSSGALAGINGNFYFDYGHLVYGRELGLDLSEAPGLHFGDPVGWFVSQGQEFSPPIFNRASYLVTEEGDAFIERVRMTAVEVEGVAIEWQADNRVAAENELGFFTNIFGF